MTLAVREALQSADVVVGYQYYFQFIKPYVREDCECVAVCARGL